MVSGSIVGSLARSLSPTSCNRYARYATPSFGIHGLDLRFMLDHYSLAVLAVPPAHGVGNFTDRGIGFHGLDDHRHQVASTTRGIFDGLQRGLPFRRITPGAQGKQALDLLALQRLVNVLQRYRLFFVKLEGVHAHNHGFVVIDRLLILVGSVLDLLLHVAALNRV